MPAARGQPPVPADRLLDALWPEGPPATADVALRVHISHLRRALDDHSHEHPRIEAVRPGYMIHVAPGELDAATFQQLVIEGQAALRRREPALAVSRLRTALGLWRWVPLSDIVPEAESWPEVDQLIELRLSALENRIEADLALGRDAEVLGELEVLVAAHPLRERLHGQLMLALYRVGRQTDALEAYRRLRAPAGGRPWSGPEPGACSAWNEPSSDKKRIWRPSRRSLLSPPDLLGRRPRSARGHLVGRRTQTRDDHDLRLGEPGRR